MHPTTSWLQKWISKTPESKSDLEELDSKYGELTLFIFCLCFPCYECVKMIDDKTYVSLKKASSVKYGIKCLSDKKALCNGWMTANFLS